MHIAIIGVGEVGRYYATHWSRAGHTLDLTFVRDRERAAEFAQRLGPNVRVQEPRQAVAGADIVLFAPRFEHIADAADAIGPVGDTILIDANNPFTRERDALVELGDGQTAATVVQRHCEPTRHVKAFHNLGIKMIDDHAGTPLVAFVASDDVAAAATVSGLAIDAGLIPLLTGPIATAAWSEPPGPLFSRPFSLTAAHAAIEAIRAG